MIDRYGRNDPSKRNARRSAVASIVIASAFGLSILLTSCAAPPRRIEASIPTSGRVDVVIDTDLTNEIDDEFALVYALLSPARLNVLAIHAAPHSLSPELVEMGALSELATRMLAEDATARGIGLRNVPSRPPGPSMDAAFERAKEIAVLLDVQPPDGIQRGAPRFLPDAKTPVPSDAVRNLIEIASQPRSTKLVVIANGAITNVASALLEDPSLAERIVVIWTAAYPSFWPRSNASFNLVQDVDAARVVFESGVELIYVPGYYVAEKLRVSRPEMVEYVQGRGPTGHFLFDLYEGHPLFGSHHAKSKVLWDLATVAFVIDSSWFQTHTVPARTFDATLRWTAGTGSPLLEAIDLDRDRVFRDFYDKLERNAR